MRPTPRLLLFVALTAGASALLSCGDPVRPELPAADVAGRYVLESVRGRGPAAGVVVLAASGWAERRVRYAQSDGSLSAESIALGSFRLHPGGAIEIWLQEDSGRSEYVWRPWAVLTDDLLTLRHPDPGDGPDIVEAYRRQ